MGVQLNVDIPGSVSALKDTMKDFELKMKFYRILLRGKAFEFEGYRSYNPDDDAQTIDWKATARSGKLLVKQFKEEQDFKVMFVIDVGEHMVAGSTKKLKCEYMAEAAAALGHLILESGDKIGLILYNDHVKDVILPQRGNTHFQYFSDVLSDSSTYGGGSNISAVLDFLIDYISKSVKGVVLISDFIRFPDSITDQLAVVGNKFETFAIMVKDPIDIRLPDVKGEIVIQDPATKQQLLINPVLAKASYEKYTAAEEMRVKGIFKHAGIDILSLSTDNPFAQAIGEFLKERVREKKVI
jgi:uncharacterized protein (DUF58 family)